MNMIGLLFASYPTLCLSIAVFCTAVFLSGVVFIVRSHRLSAVRAEITETMTPIAGDDIISTQLDLARAYLETGSAILAKTILKAVVKQGSATQREEAKRLLNHV
jgi:FimV-like protein